MQPLSQPSGQNAMLGQTAITLSYSNFGMDNVTFAAPYSYGAAITAQPSSFLNAQSQAVGG